MRFPPIVQNTRTRTERHIHDRRWSVYHAKRQCGCWHPVPQRLATEFAICLKSIEQRLQFAKLLFQVIGLLFQVDNLLNKPKQHTRLHTSSSCSSISLCGSSGWPPVSLPQHFWMISHGLVKCSRAWDFQNRGAFESSLGLCSFQIISGPVQFWRQSAVVINRLLTAKI